MFSNNVVWVYLSIIFMALGSYSLASTTKPSISLCVSATTDGQVYIEAQQKIALQRKNAGDLTEVAYQSLLQTLSEHSQWLSLDMCMSSLDHQVILYQCLADNAGNFELCAN